MASLSQAPRLGYLPSPHVAFQEHAAHMARWPTMLNSKGSWNTCILQGLTTFLPCAFTTHRQPAIEGAHAAALHRIEQGEGDDLTGIQFGLRMLEHVQHLLVHGVEQCDNKIRGRHRTGSSRLKSVHLQLEPVRDYLSTPTLNATYQTNTIG